ncbi:MAG: sigma-70 family RNA polymerase sigma factor [Candidatus Pacebacteria bacterium]|nr:sigma-70 family RNA polymerase sigma factor [Candidatus Paceibacterota bacterium]
MKEVGFFTVIAYNGFHMASEEQKKTKRKTGTDSIVEGHEERFLKAFDEYSDALFRHAIYRLSDRERAIEIVHDTFTKVWSYLRSGHEVDTYKPFLYKVINNLIIDEYRRRKELSLDSILAEEGVDEGSFPELYEGGIEELTFMLDAKKASLLICELPIVYREVLTLRFVDGLGPKEISELTEETENVVSVRIHRALKILKGLIQKNEEEAETKRLNTTL